MGREYQLVISGTSDPVTLSDFYLFALYLFDGNGNNLFSEASLEAAFDLGDQFEPNHYHGYVAPKKNFDLVLYFNGRLLNRQEEVWGVTSHDIEVLANFSGIIEEVDVSVTSPRAELLTTYFFKPLLTGSSLRLWFPQYNFKRNYYLFGRQNPLENGVAVPKHHYVELD